MRRTSRLMAGVAVLGVLLVNALPMRARDKKNSSASQEGKDQNSIGFVASKEASAKDVGLPVYPGARPQQDKSNDSPAVQLGLWGGSSGFKLVVLKLEANDSTDKVAAFYRKALAKYGKVLTCTDSAQAADHKGNNHSELSCEDDRPEHGELVLKAGTKAEQHLVGIKPSGEHSLIQLVYVWAAGSEGN